MHHGFDARLSSAQLFHSTPSSQERIRISDSVHKEALHHEITNTHDSGGTGVGRKQFADYDLTGRVFIATGGAQGLGLSMAEALADAGGKVYCLDRAPRPDEAWDEAQSRLVTEWVGSLHYKQQDITDTAHLDETITAIAEENQRLDGVIAAAGIQQLHRSFDDGKFGSTPNAQLARSLAMEWSPTQKDGTGGIRINCISPGHILTPMVRKNFEEVPGLKETWEREHMMGRLADTNEFRGAALFLMSTASSFMTASNLIIDGGHTSW
ncbi:short chain dehydrogenase [Diaporthe eres]|nr:short chain dehydrogenase [Diaporthe eres]